MTDGDSIDELEETFSVVANDIRLDILWTLWEIYTDDPEPEPEPVSFSTLRERVGVRDSGQFHYHLDEMVPQFVTHHEDGYTLTHAGAQIVAATVSGVYTDTDATFDSKPIEACPNPDCDGQFELGYREGHVFATCDTCGERRIMSAPPILVGAHDVEGDPELLGRFTMTKLHQTVRGFCYLCNGPVEGRVVQEHIEEGRQAGQNVKVVYECQACGAPSFTAATTAILHHPAVLSLLHGAGIDYRDISPWRITETLDSDERVRSDDPVRVEITVSVSGTELTFVLDGSLSVLEYSEQ